MLGGMISLRLHACLAVLLLSPAAPALAPAPSRPAPAADEPASTIGSPWAPIEAQQWTLSAARHLLDRAAFGGTPDEVRALHELGAEAAVDSLLSPGRGDDILPAVPIRLEARQRRSDSDSPETAATSKKTARRADRHQAEDFRSAWLARMVTSPHPLREKLALFWHGRFTSSMRDVKDSYAMAQQIELFRSRGLGPFDELLHVVTLDPAMLVYLNNDKNKKGQPNENFAREVMELFTLGPGHYTEHDVQEAARALTGWRRDKQTGDARFVRGRHDRDSKTFLGETGRFDAEDVLDIILEQEALAPFVAARLVAWFVHPDATPELIAPLAAHYRDDGLSTQALLRRIFLSREFYSRRARAALFKSPVEFMVSSLRRLERQPPPGHFLANACESLGQSLLAPPNVKGWEGGETWISTSTIMHRANLAWLLVGGADKSWRKSEGASAVMRSLPKGSKKLRAWSRDLDVTVLLGGAVTPAAAVQALCERLLPVAPAAATLHELETYVAPFGDDAFHPGDKSTQRLLREALHLIMSLPEYQLN
jgi:uncharacterized protein (DUF1800 family)